MGAAAELSGLGVSDDQRKAVFLAKYPAHKIVVVDFDTASVAKSCQAPPAPAGMNDFPFEEWLADIPGKGLVYVEHFGTANTKKLQSEHLDPNDEITRAMLVDASVGCDQSFVLVSPTDTKYLVSDGIAHLSSSG